MMDLGVSARPITQRKCSKIKSKMTFVQDGSCWHTAATSLQRLQDLQDNFWGKEEWPPNSLDLNPIENLWFLLKEKMKMFMEKNN